MGVIYDETLRRFPEVSGYADEGDADLPYVVVGYVVDWLRTVAEPELPNEVVRRVENFQEWCYRQPTDDTAENDAETVFRVSLLEPLFAHDALLPLLPRLLSRDDMSRNRDYFVQWVGEARYDAAARQTFLSGKAFGRRWKDRERGRPTSDNAGE